MDQRPQDGRAGVPENAVFKYQGVAELIFCPEFIWLKNILLIYKQARKLIRPGLIFVFCLLLLVFTAGCFQPAGLKLEPLPAPVLTPDSRLVSIFFDDAFYNQYEVALPVLLKYGYRATFGVITDSIGYGDGLWEYMGTEHLRKLAGYGMDIASHTRTHPHLIDNLSDKQLRQEIIDSRRDLEKLGFDVRTMVYPYYEYDERVIEYVREAGYVCARAGWPQNEAFDLTTDDPDARYHVSSTQISRQYNDNFQRGVDKAGRNSLVCLVYHLISDEGPESTSTSVADFYAQMDYLYQNGFTVVLLPELFEP
jgi:peptidoglycan/xylan/chitin deacetylase (PgdA/CDA1 family)